MSELPNSWRIGKLDELVIVNPASSETLAEDDQLVTFLPMASVEELTGKMNVSETRPFAQVKKGYTRFRDGDLLFAKITPCMENGKIAVARDLQSGIGCGSTEFHVLRPATETCIDFVRYFVLQEQFRNSAKRNMSGAVGQQRVPAEYLKQHPVPHPPPKEQMRIASKIDELFSRIDAGEAALKRAKALVERYRKSILKAAVTGELTKDWREKNEDKIEPADQLLKRILEARREAWETAELAKMKSKGKPPKDDTWKKRYTEPTASDTSELAELPEGWVWASVEQLSFSSDYGTSAKCSNGDANSVAVLRMGNLGFGSIDYENLKYLPTKHDEFPKLLLQDGDLLFNRTNSAELVGKTAVYRGESDKFSFASYLIRVKLNQLPPEYVAYFINSSLGRDWVKDVVSQQVGQANVNGSKLLALCIPIGPLDEMRQAVNFAEKQLDQIESTESQLNEKLTNAVALKNAVLSVAFKGQLISQNPEDEPASVLLERIRNASSVAKPKKTKRGK